MVRLNRAGGAKTNKYFEFIVRSWEINKNFDTNKNFDSVRLPSKFLLLTLVGKWTASGLRASVLIRRTPF